jgi:lipopolysaccharide/colanic/teichoic acid biosynthesis glycosyltransferase
MVEIELGSKLSSPPREIYLERLGNYKRVKRVIDFMLAALLLLAFGPLMLLIALGIKLHSPGPVLYRQQRIGKDGKPFEMFKFRSMRLDNDNSSHREYAQRLIREDTCPGDLGAKSLKLKLDPRITGLGRVLRKLSLDELPQFINVLRGTMSIVGPRPSLLYEYELYSEWHTQRLQVLPGLTGLWQVTARNQVSFSEMVRIDLNYIEQMSLWLDLKIMIMTPLEMLRGKGAG